MLKRVLLPQGTLSQFHNGSPAIHYIAAFELVTGGVRGNHYHRRKLEYVYLLCGSISLALRDLASGREETVVMREGDLALIETEVVHAIVPLKAGLGVEFSPVPFDPEDVFKVQLV
jgi:oxalate decarboxylase/phosphoglucose isomerase-like protein (cupin superfamily)